ncbi:VOC family protein [Paenibacillus sp. HJGM_3]|uniref:VOC family protein n=1 Tax=Paenibacillus sp. HJGM_3 TaxID=3379816 RepID=UPI003865C00A
MPRSGPVFEWDFNLLLVPMHDFEAAVQWYSEHMGWELQQRIPSSHGEKAFFGFIVLKAIGAKHDHLTRNPITDLEGNARLRFAIADYENTLLYFREQGIPFTELGNDPEGRETIEITAFGGAKLLAVNSPELQTSSRARLVRTAAIPLEVGVSDLGASVQWYTELLGMKLSERSTPEGCRLLQGKRTFQDSWIDMIWLKQIPKDQVSRGNSSSRLYFWLGKPDFLRVHEQLQRNNVEVSTILGNPDGWAVYHIVDPDGNRTNVSTCAY